jgi:uncharacterized protein (DUF111 family)
MSSSKRVAVINCQMAGASGNMIVGILFDLDA